MNPVPGMPTPGQLAWADLEFGMFTHFPPPGPAEALDQFTFPGFDANVSQAYARLGHPYNPVAALLGANHGNAEGTTAFHFQGLMRDLRIYGRALCSAELHRIMGENR